MYAIYIRATAAGALRNAAARATIHEQDMQVSRRLIGLNRSVKKRVVAVFMG